MKRLSDATLQGRLLALPTKSGIGWKGLSGTNTLAYYENFQITDIKCFITLVQSYWPSYNTPFFDDIFNLSGSPGVNLIKLVTSVIYKCS